MAAQQAGDGKTAGAQNTKTSESAPSAGSAGAAAIAEPAELSLQEALENGGTVFVGVANMVRYTVLQSNLFTKWTKASDWNKYHSSHYDWWAFPILERSSRLQFTVPDLSVHYRALVANPLWPQAVFRNVSSLLLSWGWEGSTNTAISKPGDGQRWHNWPVRLYKMGRCLLTIIACCNEALASGSSSAAVSAGSAAGVSSSATASTDTTDRKALEWTKSQAQKLYASCLAYATTLDKGNALFYGSSHDGKSHHVINHWNGTG